MKKVIALLLLAFYIVMPAETKEVEFKSSKLNKSAAYEQLVKITNGKDRCKVRDCLCKVSPGKVTKVQSKIYPAGRRHISYFQEGSGILPASQETKIKNFIKANNTQGKVDITLIGYTDGCGTKTYNKALASQRVQSIKRAIKSSMPSAKIDTVIAGEKVIGHSSEARTVETIIHTKSSLTTRIEKIPADVYLIDASGSMWIGWRHWTDLTNASFKPGSRIYLSIMAGCSSGTSLDNITPQSGTEIWYSYWKVLEYMKENETLLIISDFDANYPLTTGESIAIQRKAKEKNITVKTLR